MSQFTKTQQRNIAKAQLAQSMADWVEENRETISFLVESTGEKKIDKTRLVDEFAGLLPAKTNGRPIQNPAAEIVGCFDVATKIFAACDEQKYKEQAERLQEIRDSLAKPRGVTASVDVQALAAAMLAE